MHVNIVRKLARSQAFACRPKLADDAPGDMRVHIVAFGAEFAVALADEESPTRSATTRAGARVCGRSICRGCDRSRYTRLTPSSGATPSMPKVVVSTPKARSSET